jgi:two-component system sensor kinase FixL
MLGCDELPLGESAYRLNNSNKCPMPPLLTFARSAPMPKLLKNKQSASAPAAPARGEDRQLQAVLDTAVEGIVVIGQDGTIRVFNRAAQKMFGYAADEVVGRNVSILMAEPHRSLHDKYVSDYLRTRQPKIIGIGRELEGLRKDGTSFPIELSVSEVDGPGGKTFTGIVRDLTNRKRLEREVLDVSEREQRRIGYDLHDGLCQELAGIAFLVQAMQQRLEAGGAVTASETADVTKMLQEAVRHAKGLSKSLYPVDPQPNGLAVALAELAANTVDVFRVDCDFLLPEPVTLGDSSVATHLYRIAQEAVRDAIRHGKASWIRITLRRRRGAIELSVEDDGLGLHDNGRLRDDMVLPMICHRARVIGAKLEIAPRAHGGGVRLAALLSDTASAEHTK